MPTITQKKIKKSISSFCEKLLTVRPTKRCTTPKKMFDVLVSISFY